MATKQAYLNDSIQDQLKKIRSFFRRMQYDPTDAGIIAAALTVYEEKLIADEKLLLSADQTNKPVISETPVVCEPEK